MGERLDRDRRAAFIVRGDQQNVGLAQPWLDAGDEACGFNHVTKALPGDLLPHFGELCAIAQHGKPRRRDPV